MPDKEIYWTERDIPKHHIRNDKYTINNEPNLVFSNNPENDELLNQYPDMMDAYKSFSANYRIPLNNFILTSGTEASLRIALSCIRFILRSSQINACPLIYHYPNWGLVPIIAEMEGFSATHLFTQFRDNNFVVDDYLKLVNKIHGVAYLNDVCSNLYPTHALEPEYEVIRNDPKIISITDEVYSGTTLKAFMNQQEPTHINEQSIVIGSYSKKLGCGIRLGYILFHESWLGLMQHNRENYISHLACMYTQVNMFNPTLEAQRKAVREGTLNMIKIKELESAYSWMGDNYLVIDADAYDKSAVYDKAAINKEFIISDHRFYRLGLKK